MPATLREHIERDLAERIRSGQTRPADLTLDALSRHYGVSVTPIRQALRRLADAGLVSRGSSGRIDLKTSTRTKVKRLPEKPAPVGIPSASAELERVLSEDAIRSGLRGDDAYLREEATARKFGVGRTAIRQVFSRLVGKGLLIHVPRCGWKVRPFDAADLAAYIEVRELLEIKALELARPSLSKTDLKRMLDGNTGGRAETGIDNQIHAYLVEKSGNSYIREFFERHGAYYTTLFDYAAPETKAVRRMANQHRSILRALIAEDWEKARIAMVDHIRSQRPVVEELMRKVASGSTEAKQLESA